MQIEEALQIARDAGFEVVAPLDPQKFKFLTEVREMCAVNTCKQYGTKWSCPPACGTLEECAEQLLRYSEGVLFQTICRMDDEFDFDVMSETFQKMNASTAKLLDALIALGEDFRPFGNDGCHNCVECTYPDAPCRYPDRAFPSMEACGLMVADVCAQNNVPYYYGANTVAFTGGFLFNPKD